MNKEKQKIVPELRFPEFKNDGDWKNEPLGKFADVSKLAGYEFTKHIVYEDEGKIIALRGLNIKNNKLDLTNVKYIDNSELSKLERSKLYVDDLMFTYIGTIGEVALIEENDKYYLAPNVSRIRLNKEIVLTNFILQYFNTANFKNIEIAKYVSSSSQPALTMGNVRKFSIAIPPAKEEQQKIANCLSSLDTLITAETEKLDHLKDHKKGVLQQLFPANGETKPQYRFPEFINDGDWEEKELSVALDGKSSQIAKNKLSFIKKGYPVYGADGILGYIDSYAQEDDYIAIVKDGSGVGNLFYHQGQSSLLGTLNYLFSKDDEKYILKWLYYLLQTISFKPFIKGSGIPHIYYKDYSKMLVLIPKNPKEQQKIASCLSSTDDLIEAQKIKIKALKKHKKGLLQQLFPTINE